MTQSSENDCPQTCLNRLAESCVIHRPSPEFIVPPWSPEQVDGLNRWQSAGRYHPFTCGECRGVLLATPSGWICPNDLYRQQWAHAFMVIPLEVAE